MVNFYSVLSFFLFLHQLDYQNLYLLLVLVLQHYLQVVVFVDQTENLAIDNFVVMILPVDYFGYSVVVFVALELQVAEIELVHLQHFLVCFVLRKSCFLVQICYLHFLEISFLLQTFYPLWIYYLFYLLISFSFLFRFSIRIFIRNVVITASTQN